MSADQGNSTPAWLLVTRREVLVKVRNKTFLIGTAVMVSLLAGFLGFTAWQAERTHDFTVVATAGASDMAQAIAKNAPVVDDKVSVEVEAVATDAAAKRAVSDDKADAWLRQVGDGWVLTSESSEDTSLTRVVESVVRVEVLSANAAAVGSTVAELEAGSSVTTSFLRGDAERAEVANAVGFAFVFIFYLAALLFGMQLASSVIEEKQSRIVEIIAAAIPLRHLLAGKVLGNTVLALLQVGIYVAVGLIGMWFTPYKSYVSDISGPVAWFIVFFVAGFIALSCLWAVAGALASRAEDLQATSTPLTMLIVAIFFGAMFLDGRGEVIGSFVPPLSAVLMPKRILMGGVDWWEPLIALALLAAFALVTVWFGERLYRRALMQTGGKVSMREAWSAAE